MLRALSSYFFGSTQDDKPCEEMKCETREVKDWLVVNMPDTQDEDLDFETVDSNEDCEDDDVLACMSNLMSPFKDDSDCDEQELLRAELLKQSKKLHNLQYMFNQSSFFMIDESMALKKNDVGFSLEPKAVIDLNSAIDLLRCPVEFVTQDVAASKNRPTYKKDVMKAILCENRNARFCRKGANKKSSMESNYKAKTVKDDLAMKCKKENICHPAFTSEFCNHRPLTFHQKTDVLERIKQLEPTQRAQDQAIKKHLTKGQLNRQNKNYIYEKSSKKNRRSNLQRNNSGVNNNRKC